MNVNKVILVGRLTRDPEVRTTPTGQNVATLGMATNNFWTDKSGQKQEKTEFHTVILWGRQAETASEYLAKGASVLIEGRLKLDQWEKDGKKQTKLRVVGEKMQMLGGKQQAKESDPF